MQRTGGGESGGAQSLPITERKSLDHRGLIRCIAPEGFTHTHLHTPLFGDIRCIAPASFTHTQTTPGATFLGLLLNHASASRGILSQAFRTTFVRVGTELRHSWGELRSELMLRRLPDTIEPRNPTSLKRLAVTNPKETTRYWQPLPLVWSDLGP